MNNFEKPPVSPSESEKGAVYEREQAREILGQDYLGPEAIEKAFGIKIEDEDTPKIPFSPEDLERAKELGHFLVLRVDKAPDGSRLTMEKMGALLEDEFKRKRAGKPIDNGAQYSDEDFYSQETPEISWALVSKEIVPGSDFKNYLKELHAVVDYLKNEVFKDREMPSAYKEAIEEFDAQKKDIEEALYVGHEDAAKKITGLKIVKLTRQTPVEALYDTLAYFQNTGKRLVENTTIRTSRTMASKRVVAEVGGFKKRLVDSGMGITRGSAVHEGAHTGTILSRRV